MSIRKLGFRMVTNQVEPWQEAMTRDQVLQLYVDGAAKGNPGEAGIGAVLLDGEGNAIFKLGRYIGRATNNQAEYRGLILGLEETLALGGKDVVVFTDSELMVRQISGAYRVKDKILKRYHNRVCDLLKSFRSYRIEHIPRARNREADRLASKGASKKEESEVRSQKTEVRRQKTEVRRQKSEDRSQKTEVRRQKTEVRRQKTEDRRQKTEDRRQNEKQEATGGGEARPREWKEGKERNDKCQNSNKCQMSNDK